MTDRAAGPGTPLPRSSSFRLVDLLAEDGRRVAHLTREPARDACPLCGVRLGAARGSTRRQPVMCATPGSFTWRCPDCGGYWNVKPDGSSRTGRRRA